MSSIKQVNGGTVPLFHKKSRRHIAGGILKALYIYAV